MARFAYMIGWGAFVLALAPHAHAGPTGTSESGSSSSDGGTSDSGTSDSGASSSDGGSTTTSESSSESGATTTSTDGGSESTTSTTSGADETGACSFCGELREGPGSITITAPEDGANVDAPFTVTATVTPTCDCSPCPCIELAPQYTQVFLDTVAVGAPCYQGECAWEITADVGTHTIYAAATFGPDDIVGTTIEVHVQSVAPSTDDGLTTADDGPPPTSSDTTGSTANAGEDAPKGCGCAASSQSKAGAWLVVLAAFFRRRRTHR